MSYQKVFINWHEMIGLFYCPVCESPIPKYNIAGCCPFCKSRGFRDIPNSKIERDEIILNALAKRNKYD